MKLKPILCVLILAICTVVPTYAAVNVESEDYKAGFNAGCNATYEPVANAYRLQGHYEGSCSTLFVFLPTFRNIVNSMSSSSIKNTLLELVDILEELYVSSAANYNGNVDRLNGWATEVMGEDNPKLAEVLLHPRPTAI